VSADITLHILSDAETWLDRAAREAAHKVIVRCGYPDKAKSHSCGCTAAMKVIRAEMRKGMMKAGVSEEPR